MPINFPPGTPVTGSATPLATLVFTPNPAAQASVRVQNIGSGTIYVGGANVSPVSGFAILPGNRPIELQNVNSKVYVASGFASATLAGTAPAVASGATAVTLTSGSVAAGQFLQVGNATGMDYVQVVTASANGATLTTSAFTYDHASGSSVYTLAVTPTGYVVTAGVG